MTDYISREAAIEAIEGINWYKYNDEGRLVQGGTSHDKMFLPYKAVEGTLNALPAADVREVKMGHWIGVDEFPHEDWECDVCGSQAFGNDRIPQEFHFCPNCGADMREKTDEN